MNKGSGTGGILIVIVFNDFLATGGEQVEGTDSQRPQQTAQQGGTTEGHPRRTTERRGIHAQAEQLGNGHGGAEAGVVVGVGIRHKVAVAAVFLFGEVQTGNQIHRAKAGGEVNFLREEVDLRGLVQLQNMRRAKVRVAVNLLIFKAPQAGHRLDVHILQRPVQGPAQAHVVTQFGGAGIVIGQTLIFRVAVGVEIQPAQIRIVDQIVGQRPAQHLHTAPAATGIGGGVIENQVRLQ